MTSGFSFRKLFYPIPLTFMRSSDSRRNVYVAELEMRPRPGNLSAGDLARTACSAYARAHGGLPRPLLKFSGGSVDILGDVLH